MRRPFRGGFVRLKHLSQSGAFPSGNPRYYYRPKGQKGVALPDLRADDPAFLAAYMAAAGGQSMPVAPVLTGTIAAAIIAFRKSDKYHGVADSTRQVWRRHLEKMRDAYGRGRLKDLQPQHIRADLGKLIPSAAVQRHKVWRALLKWCFATGLVNADPSEAVARPEMGKTTPHAPWTDADVAAFRAHWPVGTQQRLCMEIMGWVGCRMSDAVRLGDGMVRDGWLTFTQQKTGGEVAIPMDNAPAWAGSPDNLTACLNARNARHMVWLTTFHDAPRSAKAASQWLAAAARKAGVEKGSHGIRAWRANSMKEAGATVDQRAAWLGHESVRQTEAYSKGADKRRLLTGPKQERKVPTFGG